MVSTAEKQPDAFSSTHADFAGFIIDSDAYYDAFYQLAKTARERLIIIGWDIDLRVKLHRELDENNKVHARHQLGSLLKRLVENNPDLEIYLLIWNSPRFLGTEQDNLKNLSFAWTRHQRIRLVFESPPLVFCSLHEKFVIVDNEVAFLGGMDITAKRWDTAEHLLDDPRRRDPLHRSYVPYHDIQVMVTGEVVDELAKLAVIRWHQATGETLKPCNCKHRAGKLPETFYSLENMAVQIHLTRPAFAIDQDGAYQIERFHRETISRSQSLIYLEHQYIADDEIVDLLCSRLSEQDGPQIIICIQQEIPELVGKMAMGAKSAQQLHRLIEADRHGHLSIISPYAKTGQRRHAIKVHSKLLIADRQSLSIGSANLNRRSFQLDYEVNLGFLARQETERKAMHGFLLQLLARHARVTTAEIEQTLVDCKGNWQAALRQLAKARDNLDWRSRENISLYSHLPRIEDATEPSNLEKIINTLIELSPGTVLRRTIYSFLSFIGFLLVLTGLWYFLNLYNGEQGRQLVQSLIAWLEHFPAYTWRSLFWGVAVGMLSTLMMVPTLLLVLGFVSLWGGFFGGLVAFTAMLAASHAYYFTGRLIGLPGLAKFKNVQRVLNKVKVYGFWGVAITRIVPTGPFFLVNLATGSIGFKWWDMLLGSIIGLLPGIVMISAFSGALTHALRERSLFSGALVVAVGLLYLAALHYIVKLARRAMVLLKQQREDCP